MNKTGRESRKKQL